MFLAAEIYQDQQYYKSALKSGDFILLAQMPAPQPGWARRFEPPAITEGESQGLINVLMHLYKKTGNKKYLEPIPRALKYYKSVELPGKKLARFHELKTNKPLYFTKDYQLNYS